MVPLCSLLRSAALSRLYPLPTPYLEEAGCTPCGASVLLVAQSCPALCKPMDGSPPGSSVHGILQAGIQEWVAISFSRGILLTQRSNSCLLHCRQILYRLSHQRNLACHVHSLAICGCHMEIVEVEKSLDSRATIPGAQVI